MKKLLIALLVLCLLFCVIACGKKNEELGAAESSDTQTETEECSESESESETLPPFLGGGDEEESKTLPEKWTDNY